jgi:lipoprotein-anchoring transpeptidase ErfK/SrfK
MKQVIRSIFGAAAVLAVSATVPNAAFAGEAAADAPGDLRIEVNKSARELYVYNGGERLATHPVAIGQPDHETPSGEWGIHKVDWNPDWTPPDSDWAEGREYKAPGHPDNPMGRVRMQFKGTYSIHGTDALESLGQRKSHGSIRLANEVIVELAPMVMEHGGSPRSEEWVQEALDNPEEMREVWLSDPVRIVIYD